jgi:carbon starvation protein
MLLEGMVACVSIACVMIIASDVYNNMPNKAPNFIYARGIGAFMQLIGVSAAFGISFGLMAFTTFVYDTLDICTRLGRYIVQELTGLKNMAGILLGAGLTTAVPIFFLFQTMTDAAGKPIHAYLVFWGTFGSSNQLLAALALIGISIWLKKGGNKNPNMWLVSFLPAVWMFTMSIWSLCITVYQGWILKLPTVHWVLPYVSSILIVLAFLVAIETVISMSSDKQTSVKA